MSRQKNRKWKRIESSEIHPSIYGQLNFKKRAKVIKCTMIVFSSVGTATTGNPKYTK